MLIQDARTGAKRCQLRDIKAGTAFEFQNGIFVKIDDIHTQRVSLITGNFENVIYNAVDIADFKHVTIRNHEFVTPLSAVIQIYDALPEQEDDDDS